MNKTQGFLLIAAFLILIALTVDSFGSKTASIGPLPIDKELMEEPERMRGMEAEMGELRKENEYLKAVNSDLQNEINYLTGDNERLEAENLRLEDTIQTLSSGDVKEKSSEEYIDLTIKKFWGYTECGIYGTQNFCTKLEVVIDNTGTNSIYFDPYRDTWLMDDSLVQYNLVRTGGDSEFRSGKIYPNTVKRGYLYYYPAVPLKSKNITFYAGINGEGIKKVITYW